MEAVICQEDGCENIIEPDKMEYGKDFYVLVNLTPIGPDADFDAQYIIDKGLVGVYCKNCGYIVLVETRANGFEVVSRRKNNG